MLDKGIIQALKVNLKRYDRLAHDENGTLESIGYKFMKYLNTSKGIWEQVGRNGGRPEDTVFRIVPDYEPPEDKTEDEYTIHYNKDSDYFYIIYTQEMCLSSCVDSKDFIGFKYEDGKICTSARLYRLRDSEYHYNMLSEKLLHGGQYKVLTPTHVLFRSTK